MKKGSKLSEEHKRKISETLKGRKHSKEIKKKISETLKNRIISKKHKRKISKSHKGKTISNETKRKISNTLKIRFSDKKNHPNFGRKFSEETLKKMSESAKKRGISKEAREKISENAKIRFSNPMNHPNWKGGISCEPYCQDWTKEYKEYIRERDNNECQNPDCWKKHNHLTMTVHHIDYNKKNCVPENLITLCRSCNTRANKNRDEWQILYENIIGTNYET